MSTELYLIRHGESVANVEPIIGGMRGDAGLTDRGRQQAGLLEERLRTERLGADQLYVSTLPRALETGEYVERALQLAMQGDDDLQELRPGEADGLEVQSQPDAVSRAQLLYDITRAGYDAIKALNNGTDSDDDERFSAGKVSDEALAHQDRIDAWTRH